MAITPEELLAIHAARPKNLANEIAGVLDVVAYFKMVSDGAVALAADDALTAKNLATQLQTALAELINDTSSGLASTYSSSKIDSLVQGLADQVASLTGTDLSGVLAAIQQINNELGGVEGLLAALAGAVTTNPAQTLTAEEQGIVLSKIGAISASMWDSFFTGYIADKIGYVLAQVAAFQAGSSVNVSNYVTN